LVFLDTNVLLAPYQSTADTFEAIAKTYRKIRDEKRLIIPAQVAREFARNRPTLIAELHKLVRDARSVAVSPRFEPPPILQDLTDCKDAQAQMTAANDALKKFRKSIEALIRKVETWERTDPVLEAYEDLFTADIVKDTSLDRTAIEALRQRRYAARIPPGFRDKAKDDGGIGDLIVWFTILEVSSSAGRDAIFVTEERKDDWFHRSGDQALFPDSS